MAKILVVDDNAANRKVLVALLSHDGHLTIEAADGMDGLAVARAQRPQLVITDIVMPSMDGFGLVQALRADRQLRDIRVIFHTATYHEREALTLARACDAVCVLVKPCSLAALLKAVEQALAGMSETIPSLPPASFDREHLLLITNKLSERCNAVEACNSRFEALLALSIELAADSEPRLLLEKVCAGARSLLGAVYAVLVVMHDAADEVRFCTTSGIDWRSGAHPVPAPVPGPIRSVMSQRRAWRSHGVDGAGIDVGLPHGYPAARAVLAVPLDNGDRVIGWLCLVDKIGAAAFDEDDERLLTGLGALAARLYRNRCAQSGPM